LYLCNQCGKEKDEKDFYKSDLELARRGLWTSCKDCHKARGVKCKRTLRRKVRDMYFGMVRRSQDDGLQPVRFKIETFIQWANRNNVESFYNRWVESGYDKGLAPSVDRIHSTGDYTLKNIQLCTWKWNDWKKNNHDGLLFDSDTPF